MAARRLLALALFACATAAGCTGWQSALDPHGPGARALDALFWPVTVALALIWLAVMLVLVAALMRRQRPAPQHAARRSGIAVWAATLGTVLVITALTAASHLTTRSISHAGAEPLVIQVRGHQWWWQVTYPGTDGTGAVATANEIHLPVGRQVRIELSAADVIHSFWVPNLGGKQDMIPGRDNHLTVVAEAPGIYRGQCAEFCGLQHAHMALLVIAEAPAEFEAWLAAQRQDAAPPADPVLSEGQRVFEQQPCGACHRVRGTAAAGEIGPDLTHFASRRMIAAGVLPMTRGAIAAWIADPQTIKPGSSMPLVPLTPDELQAVSAWLASLR
ncbi:cytochrome c oxidase subunit II [Plastoroseomonas hellenica]|uniref:cytochrome c oxidase subunit II n=1 Tax=Plastoroseomonas hellenica TaxID=2687306 RepID=UPI001BA9EA4F|nr:cytochrome c oxidase subunit II [Plastoroseomonas hellenica]MBR0645403.1 cytochrome c oxidase subunit II [Plastoroseomonas hellenica]